MIASRDTRRRWQLSSLALEDNLLCCMVFHTIDLEVEVAPAAVADKIADRAALVTAVKGRTVVAAVAVDRGSSAETVASVKDRTALADGNGIAGTGTGMDAVVDQDPRARIQRLKTVDHQRRLVVEEGKEEHWNLKYVGCTAATAAAACPPFYLQSGQSGYSCCFDYHTCSMNDAASVCVCVCVLF